MNRQAAEKLIGQQVMAWTAANGVYVGELVKVIPSRPWRGEVLITGVLKPATPFEIGRLRQRRGLRIGQKMEVGGISIKPTAETGTAYLVALQAQLVSFEKMRQTAPEKNYGWIDKSIIEIKLRINEAERKEPKMIVTTEHNDTITAFLTNEGVNFNIVSDEYILIDRNSMVQNGPSNLDENQIYQWWFERISHILPSDVHLCWGGRTDDYLGVEVWRKNSC